VLLEKARRGDPPSRGHDPTQATRTDYRARYGGNPDVDPDRIYAADIEALEQAMDEWREYGSLTLEQARRWGSK
jgi:hypothetical protein